MTRILLAAIAASAAFAAPAFAENPFEISNQRCVELDELACNVRLQSIDTGFVTIEDYMQVMRISFDRLVEINGWQGMNIDPSMEIPFKMRVAHGQFTG